MTTKYTVLKATISKLTPTALKSISKLVIVTPPLLTQTAPITYKTVLLGFGTKLGLYGLAMMRKIVMIIGASYGMYLVIVDEIEKSILSIK